MFYPDNLLSWSNIFCTIFSSLLLSGFTRVVTLMTHLKLFPICSVCSVEMWHVLITYLRMWMEDADLVDRGRLQNRSIRQTISSCFVTQVHINMLYAIDWSVSFANKLVSFMLTAIFWYFKWYNVLLFENLPNLCQHKFFLESYVFEHMPNL